MLLLQRWYLNILSFKDTGENLGLSFGRPQEDIHLEPKKAQQ